MLVFVFIISWLQSQFQKWDVLVLDLINYNNNETPL